MAVKRKYGKRKVYRKRRTSGGKIRRGGKASLKKIIKSLITRSQETKGGSYVFTDSLCQVGHAAFTTDIHPVGLSNGAVAVSQGTGAGGRIGNKVSIVNSTIKGQIWPAGYDGITNLLPAPYLVQMYLFYDKTDPVAIPAPETDFFQVGNADQAMTGTLADLDYPLNKDKYRVCYKRTFKVGNANFGGTGTSAFNQSYANNDFKLVNRFSVNIKKYMPKEVRFNDTSSAPTTRGLFLMFNTISATGANPSAVLLPVKYNIVQAVNWKDA